MNLFEIKISIIYNLKFIFKIKKNFEIIKYLKKNNYFNEYILISFLCFIFVLKILF